MNVLTRRIGVSLLVGATALVVSCGDADSPEPVGESEFASTTVTTESPCSTADPPDYDNAALGGGTYTIGPPYGSICANTVVVDWTESAGRMRFTANWAGQKPTSYLGCIGARVKLRVNLAIPHQEQPILYTSPADNAVEITGTWNFVNQTCTIAMPTIDEPSTTGWDVALWVRAQAWAKNSDGTYHDVTLNGYTF